MRERLQIRYETTFDLKLGKAWGFGKHLRDEGRGLLIEEAQAFRGGSPFTAAVLTSNARGGLSPQTYDLFWLLMNADLDLLSEDQFKAKVATLGAELTTVQRSKPCAYFALHAYRSERSDLVIRLPPELAAWDAARQQSAQVLQGLKVDLAGCPWLNELNRHLVGRKVVGLIVPGLHPLDVSRRLRLPLLFPIHRYEDTNGVVGSVAFARQALLLDTMLRRRPLNTGQPDSPIIC